MVVGMTTGLSAERLIDEGADLAVAAFRRSAPDGLLSPPASTASSADRRFLQAVVLM